MNARFLRSAYNIFFGKPDGKRALGRPGLRCKVIIMNLKEVGWKDANWMSLTQDRDFTGLT
jgi:hypothetical protein